MRLWKSFRAVIFGFTWALIFVLDVFSGLLKMFAGWVERD